MARLAHQPLERRTPVTSDEVLREELPRMLRQPERDGVSHWDLPLDPPLKGEHQGADQPLELPHGVLDGAIGLRLVRGGGDSCTVCTPRYSATPVA
eukprot:13064491-Alexandrium_andersonii.AAC.1